ncbi:MAG: rod shape-determining protein RodA [Clostridia bacterium]|nr:rod shape-determining protein RodA [Clostridia bacterium]
MYFVEKTRSENLIKRFDYILFAAVLALSVIGLIAVKSASMSRSDGGTRMFMMQAICLGIGIIVSMIISTIDYKDFKTFGIILYIGSIGLMVLAVFKGSGDELGNRNWLNFAGISLQPSELTKVAFVVVASIFLERIKEGLKGKDVIKLSMYAGLPIALVLAQKDLGTSLVFLFMFFVMIFICGIPYKYLLAMGGTLMASLPFIWIFALNNARRDRILVFLNLKNDPTGADYNVIAAKRAIGSGQLTGKGLFKGIQNMNGSVPVKESDFIFTVIGEELGFIGCTVVILLIFFILIKLIYIAKNSRDAYGAFIVVGFAGMFAFHAIESIGMAMGLMPVTGIPLPFVSQGGTALVVNYIAMGVVLSVSMRRTKTIFNTT